MNDSVHKSKADLILQAAKNVLDDPLIDFDTPEGAKEALMKETARIKKREEIDDTEKLEDIVPPATPVIVPPATPVEKFMDHLFDFSNMIFDFSDMYGYIPENFNRYMKLFDEACQKYGYQKNKDGSYHLRGDPALKVAHYIDEHWFDNLKDDNGDPTPGNLTVTHF